MKKMTSSPSFSYRVCYEKSKEFSLSIRDFNEKFIKPSSKNAIVHPLLIHSYVREALEYALSRTEVPLLRTTLKNTAQFLKFFRVLRHNEEVETTAEIQSLKRKKDRIIVTIKTQTRMKGTGDIVSEGVWEFESKQ